MKFYVCSTDWQEVMEGGTDSESGPLPLYKTIEDIRISRGCGRGGCGIIEVEVDVSQWIGVCLEH